MSNNFLNNPIDNCPNLTKVYFTSTTAGYVEGNTWFNKPLVYLEQEVIQDGLIYTLSSVGAYYSVKPENKSITTANILSEINGIPVTTIESNAFSGCTALTSVTIPDSVTTIEYGAFGSCTSLTSITIPDSVTAIWSGGFYNCTALKIAIIGINVESLTTNSFSNCTSLTTFIIRSNSYFSELGLDGDYHNNPISNCPNLTKVYFTSTTAGYVEGKTWFNKPLKYTKWNGTDSITIDADVSNFTTTDETVTVDKITNTYERYTDTDPDGNTFSQDTGNYVFKYDNLTGLWICMNYYGGPQIKNDSTSYKQFCWLGTYGSEYTQYYNIVQCDSNTHEILNDPVPDLLHYDDYAYVYSSYNFVEILAGFRPLID